ncbi:hypothetical protein [Pseudonocardia sp. N23]|uniref:hypothetical protein n=1 Tax=Pseudonocardia sp. N23 TaxID=1987376 RepID=UPI000BFCEBAC|nr:hypothetical protein [Pseudonocardia sp. N23]GAY10030.1 hypothetical protein TOK_4386 [Pseudonocardia sp. N23]
MSTAPGERRNRWSAAVVAVAVLLVVLGVWNVADGPAALASGRLITFPVGAVLIMLVCVAVIWVVARHRDATRV